VVDPLVHSRQAGRSRSLASTFDAGHGEHHPSVNRQLVSMIDIARSDLLPA